MSYEEIVNGATKASRAAACRRDYLIDQATRWGGWIMTALMAVMLLATHVH